MSGTTRNRIGGGLAAAIAVAGVCAALSTGAATAAPTTDTAIPQLVPKPVSMTTGDGTFTLSTATRIVAASAATKAVANDLAADLAPATGYPLPVTGGTVHSGDIQLVLGDPGTLGADTQHEGYQLTVTPDHVTLVAPQTHGLFNGVQTIRQLLPAWIASSTVRPGPWTMPAVSITDYPRYAYRGFMFDIARHYEPPTAVEHLIDVASSYKFNTFHLHLSDDQGFRVVIKGFPNLTAIGGQGRSAPAAGRWTRVASGRRRSSSRSWPTRRRIS